MFFIGIKIISLLVNIYNRLVSMASNFINKKCLKISILYKIEYPQINRYE
jgi:hypothetical protein